MRAVPLRTASRAGFTLVEMLVVIAIILILVGLISAAVMRMMSKPAEVTTRTEINQLANAVDQFKVNFKVNYLPSKIKLCEKYSSYGTTQLDLDSMQFLTRMFPRIDTTSWTSTGFDWNGDGDTNDNATLEGDQCLVFFLGGIPTSGSGVFVLTGFSTSPINPVTGAARTAPLFDFHSKRLFDRKPGTPDAGFPSYQDPYETLPYVYFSSYKQSNGYDRYGSTDCALVVNGAYYQATSPAKIYLKPDSFQIISAGANKKFGPGGLWTPATAPNVASDGVDDMVNFHNKQLGVP